MRLLEREARVTLGQVPAELGGVRVEPGYSRLDGDCFLMRCEGGLSFFYRKGEGITIERAEVHDPQAEALWLNGSVYAALASINGLKPIHASAVAWEGRVHAFTGPSGAGKSTLVAALGRLGLPLFCDDTLVLDLSDPERVICMPGHKRLKLTPEALVLTGSAREDEVGVDTGKFFATPPSGIVREALPLAELVFLEEAPQVSIEPLRGAERFVRLEAEDHYTEELYALSNQADRAERFAHNARLASQVAMARFARPRDRARFDEGARLVAGHIMSHG